MLTSPLGREHGAASSVSMNSRSRIIITLTWLCHQLLALLLVTSWLHAQESPVAKIFGEPSASQGEDVTIKALTQEKDGAIYKLIGNAEIDYESYIIHADEITYDSASGQVTADGHMLLEGGPNDEHIEAHRGQYNIRNETGRFEGVAGGIGVRLRGNRVMLTSSNPFSFSGKVVEKTSPYHYVVYDGTVTTCELPQPKWQFRAHKVVVDVGGNAKIYQSAFFLHGIPILYFPFATHPAQKNPRQSGFLIPNIGQSSVKGTILGESVFLALNRSMDATIGAEYFSLRGWAPQGQFRARPSDTSFVDLNFFSVLDRGIGHPPADQGGGDVRLSAGAAFGHNFRGVADIDYLSSFVFRLAFNEVFTQAVNSEVKSTAFLSNTTNGYFYNIDVQRYQNFESTTPGDVVTILHAPTIELSSVHHKIGHSPFYWSYDSALGGLARSDPSFSTAPLVGRFDFAPTISLPLLIDGWSLRPEVSARNTFYTQKLIPSTLISGPGTAVSDSVDRNALDVSIDIRPPTLDRVFGREFLGRKWKHVVEPHIGYRYVTGVHNFANIIRFDQRDILSDTNEFEYGIVNRLYAKRTTAHENCEQPGMPTLFIGGAPPHGLIPWEKNAQVTVSKCEKESEVREVLTWELAQKYFFDPTFGGALIPGQPNVFATTEDLTGIAYLTEARRLSPLVSRLRVLTSSHTDLEWDIDYDFHASHINASTVLANYRAGPFTIGGGDAFLQAPGETILSGSEATPALFNQFRLLLGYGYPNKRGFSGAANVGFDANLNFLQYGSLQAAYNWDCCGINIEYRRFALGEVRNENQYRFTFALANIGAFGNLRRDARLF
jgi:LPS-assembly protein